MTIATMVLILPMTIERTEKAMSAIESPDEGSGRGCSAHFDDGDHALRSMMFGAVCAWSSRRSSLASIPALEWWYLSRPAARAACMKQPKPESPEAGLAWETTA